MAIFFKELYSIELDDSLIDFGERIVFDLQQHRRGDKCAKYSTATKRLELVGKSIRALHRVAITAANNYSLIIH
jgi:hypothetical protein